MSYNLESFCPEPWSQIEIDSAGDFKICCLANFNQTFGLAMDSSGRVLNIMTDTIQAAQNSQSHRDHRLELSRNTQPQQCRSCYDSERATAAGARPVSKRQRVLRQSQGETPGYVSVETAAQVTDRQGGTSAPIVNLDLRLGNTCNYKCIMCSPRESSLWMEDYPRLQQLRGGEQIVNKGQRRIPIRITEQGKPRIDHTEWWQTDRWWQQFDTVKDTLCYVYFTSGEPLLAPAMTACLDRMISWGRASEITLRYDTNLSALNPRVMERWQHFRRVRLCVSIDDTEDRYELIRFPGRWTRFDENLTLIQENNIEVEYLSSCIGLASPLSMTRVADYADQRNLPLYFRFLEVPRFFDLRILPKTAKRWLQNQLRQAGGSQRAQQWYSAEQTLLEDYISSEDLDQVREFVRFMDCLDLLRGTEWRQTLPDVVTMLSHCDL